MTVGKTAYLDITLKPGVWVDPPKLFQQIAGAGYQARRDDVLLTMTGEITKEGDRLLLTVRDVKPSPQVFLLAPAKDGKEQADSRTAFDQLPEYAGRTVEVEGFWRPPAKGEKRALLLVRRAAPAAPAARR